jgi:menaquinone-dependent protoporphyrinogen oxidase
METKVLVAYASSYGSTQEAAEFVAETIRSHGLAVDLQPMGKVRTLDGYSALVLGISIYMFHWHKDATHFLSKHQKVLSGGMPAAIFTGGPISAGDEKEWQAVRGQVDQELAKYAWFKPVSVEIIGGKFDPAKLRFPYSLIPALRRMPAKDLRDWAAIRAWANSLVEQFQPALT